MHKLDKKWVFEQVGKLPAHLRKGAIDSYNRVHQEASGLEPVDHMKSNKARRAANTRLRIYVERITNGTNR